MSVNISVQCAIQGVIVRILKRSEEMEKKIIICGVVGGDSTTTDAIIKSIEDTHNCKFDVVSLSDSEKCELRELVPIPENELFIYPNMQVGTYSLTKAFVDLQKRNSQAGWKSGNKYMRNKR